MCLPLTACVHTKRARCLIDYVNPTTQSWRYKQGTYWLLSIFVYAYLWPSFATAATLSPGWISLLVLRNLVVEVLWYGGYHYLLYVALVSPIETKFNPKFPRNDQHRRDMFWTTVGFLINSAIEVGFLHLWATRRTAKTALTRTNHFFCVAIYARCGLFLALFWAKNYTVEGSSLSVWHAILTINGPVLPK